MIGEAVLEFLAEATALAVVFGLVGAVISGAALALLPARPGGRTVFFSAVAGAMIVAALADRLGVPRGWVLEIGRRVVPLAWSAVGATIGTAVALLAGLRKRTSPTAAAG